MTQKKNRKANKPTPTKTAKRDWGDMKHRDEGKKDFLKALRLDPDERKRCIKDPAYAKTSFAYHGRFNVAGKKLPKGAPKFKAQEAIPKSTEFRVYDKKDFKKRDELVTIVLPADGTQKERIAQDWRCTYTPWASKQKPKRS